MLVEHNYILRRGIIARLLLVELCSVCVCVIIVSLNRSLYCHSTLSDNHPVHATSIILMLSSYRIYIHVPWSQAAATETTIIINTASSWASPTWETTKNTKRFESRIQERKIYLYLPLVYYTRRVLGVRGCKNNIIPWSLHRIRLLLLFDRYSKTKYGKKQETSYTYTI